MIKPYEVLIVFSKIGKTAKVCEGKYIGETIPNHKEDRNTIADLLRDLEMKNPTIETKNGILIYGCECWWGEKNEMLKMVESYELKYITVQEILNSGSDLYKIIDKEKE